MNPVIILVAVAAFVVFLLWATRGLMDSGRGRCPTCGRDRGRYPHHPNCNYWRDR